MVVNVRRGRDLADGGDGFLLGEAGEVEEVGVLSERVEDGARAVFEGRGREDGDARVWELGG